MGVLKDLLSKHPEFSLSDEDKIEALLNEASKTDKTALIGQQQPKQKEPSRQIKEFAQKKTPQKNLRELNETHPINPCSYDSLDDSIDSSPAKILEFVDTNYLIKKNTFYRENVIKSFIQPEICYICGVIEARGIILNDRNTYVCDKCLNRMQNIKLPEVYQKRLETYLADYRAFLNLEGEFHQWKSLQKVNEELNLTSKPQDYDGCFHLLIGGVALLVSSAFPIAILIPIFLYLHHSSEAEKVEKDKQAWLEKKKRQEDRIAVENEKLQKEIEQRQKDLEKLKPIEPEIKDFSDPDATISNFDRKVMKVFLHWPGYPPFWKQLREKALGRYGEKCFVLGCPSRATIHVHHKVPISCGGLHKIENLVPLCAFHHALEPSDGHEKIFDEVGNEFFTVVSEHFRCDSFVASYIRRKSLATTTEIKHLAKEENFSCSECKKSLLMFNTGDTRKRFVKIYCPECKSKWKLPNGCLEEIGPELCNHFHPSIQSGERMEYIPPVSLTSRTSDFFRKYTNG